jgi:hypothetical protein
MICHIIDRYLIYHLCQSSSKELSSGRLLIISRRTTFFVQTIPVQSAYRSHHSTETALLRVMNDLLLASDDGNGTLLTLLGFSAAFDTIDHEILFERLVTRFGIAGGSLEWLKSYMTERSQLVRVPGAESSPVILEYGVPQGSVLGPLIFILYSSPLNEIISRFGIKSLFFSDDAQLYMSFPITTDERAENCQ